jgi:ribosome maturation factor RimP
MGAEEQIAEALRPAVQAAGLEIWDVERSGATVRVLVERPGGVDVDSISQLSTAISATLDQHDELVPAGRYLLEVSSPGLERRLRYPDHFARYIGEEVTVKTVEPVNDTRRLRGTLTGASEDDITIRVSISRDGTTEIRVPLGSVQRANAVFAWGQAQKGAKPNTAAKKSPKATHKAPTEAAGEAVC